MSKRDRKLTPADSGNARTRAEKRRLFLQRLFDSIPGQIDAIREKKENDAIELRRFVMRRERKANKPVIEYSKLKYIGNGAGSPG